MRRLLLVDDEEDVIDSLVMALERDFEVHTASDGRAALERLTAEPFDAVLLDLMMPVLSGEELLTELAGKPHPPIVVVSASRDLRESCERLGVKHYIQKPYRLAELRAKLADALRDASAPPAAPSK